MDQPLLIVVFALVAAGIAVGTWYYRRRRREAFGAFALRHGLEYSLRDPFGLVGLPFRLFQKGDGRRVENVLWGDWRGEPVRAFDYWYYEESTDSRGSRTRSYHRFSCVLLEIPASFPQLSIARENLITRLADGIGFRDIEMESEEFNRRFQIGAADRKFAYALIDARMMKWLLGLRRAVAFEVLERWVLVYVKKRMAPAGFAPIIEMALAFRDRIPRAAWSMYGRGTEITQGEARP